MEDNLTAIVTECAVDVDGRMVREDTELAELSKLNNCKVSDIRKFNMKKIDHALKNGGSLKAVKRKLGVGKSQMYALSDKEDNVISNIYKIVKVAEEAYTILYNSEFNQSINERDSSAQPCVIQPVKKEEVKKALGAMEKGKAAGEDKIN
ncbi:hypothetical protein V5799_034455 [Amblyomma americanum]|uniref:Uncharacterized protein n=1 Tax=Amblyomma americanum TaxID=6943 RepID=A0AAQ4DKF1_AMBAM